MNKTVIIILITILVLIGGFLLFKVNVQAPVENNSQQNNELKQSNETSTNNYDIIYTNSGYSPKTLTIKLGDTVTWKNESSHGMWTSSAIHPTHIIYSGTSLDEHCPDTQNNSFDECQSDKSGTSWSFTFDKKGIWKYHNHVLASDFGTIIVE